MNGPNDLTPSEEWNMIINSAKIEEYTESLWDIIFIQSSPSIQPTYECWSLVSALQQQVR